MISKLLIYSPGHIQCYSNNSHYIILIYLYLVFQCGYWFETLFTRLFFEWNSVLICRLCTMGVLPTVKTLTLGHFLPLKPFSIGQILTLFENCFTKWMSYFKKNWDQDQYFFKKSRLLTKKEPFLETKTKITKVILNSCMVSKKLFKIKITALPWWKNWDNCTVLSSPYYCIFDFEQFFWNHFNFFQVSVKPSEVSTFFLVFLGKSWNH